MGKEKGERTRMCVVADNERAKVRIEKLSDEDPWDDRKAASDVASPQAQHSLTTNQ